MKSYLLYNFAICSLTKIGSYTLNISQMTVSELRVVKKMVCSNRWYLKNSEILSLDYLLVQKKKRIMHHVREREQRKLRWYIQFALWIS